MLRQILQDKHNFIAKEKVDGALLKVNISEVPDNAFSTKGMNKFTRELGISFSKMTYAKPRMDTPCLYGACHILDDSIGVASEFSWKDLIRIKRNNGGIFVIRIDLTEELSFHPRLVVSFDVETVPIDVIQMSPILALIPSNEKAR